MTMDKWQANLRTFKSELAGYSWFENIGKLDPGLAYTRVDFNWMVRHDAFRYATWGEALLEIENPIDRAVYDQAALDLRNQLTSELMLERIVSQEKVDAFFLGIDDSFGTDGGFVPGADLYPHEIAELPQRLVSYAGLERCLIESAQHSPVLKEAMLLLARGFWPAGWEGSWPNGRILVW
jgi:hypothetical protein